MCALPDRHPRGPDRFRPSPCWLPH